MNRIFNETCESGDFSSLFSSKTDTRDAFSVWHVDDLVEKEQIPLGGVGAYDPVLNLKLASGNVAYRSHTLTSAVTTGTVWFPVPINLFFDRAIDEDEWPNHAEVRFLQFRDNTDAMWTVACRKADEIDGYRVGLITEAGNWDDASSGIVVPDSEMHLEIKITVDTAAANSVAQMYFGREPVGSPTTGFQAAAEGLTTIRWGCVEASTVQIGYLQFGDFGHNDEQLFPPFRRTSKLKSLEIWDTTHLALGSGTLVSARRWGESDAGTSVKFYDTVRNEQWQSRHLDIVDEGLKVTTGVLNFHDGLLAVVEDGAVATVQWLEGTYIDEVAVLLGPYAASAMRDDDDL